MKARPGFTNDAEAILRRRFFSGRPEMQALLERERENAEAARQVYDLRAEAGLTQAQLARRVGTTASVISRLEDADYEGRSLTMLRRIAEAVGKEVVILFVPKRKAGKRPARKPKKAAARRKPKAARKSRAR